MTMPSSGSPIDFSQLQTEFGGLSPISLDEYYRGGTYVSSNLTVVPGSGAIAIGSFYGTYAATEVSLSYTGGSAVGGKAQLVRYGYSNNHSYVGPTFGSNLSPTSTGSTGWNTSMSIKVAAMFESTNGDFDYYFEATGSGAPNMTWWTKVTIRRSGYNDIPLLRSNATTNTFSNYRYYLKIPAPSGTGYTMLGAGTITWEFSD